MDQRARLTLILQEINEAEPVASLMEARTIIEDSIFRVEERYSGVPCNPENHRADGRIYPPQDDREVRTSWVDIRVFRTRGHFVALGANGAIRISKSRIDFDALDAEVELDKPGSDGRFCLEQGRRK
jgi:hypothetical protein